MEQFTQNQELLRDYLKAVEIPAVDGLLILAMLWEEEATQEMLDYILETQEDDPAKLYEIACEISEKYKSETEEDWDED